MNLRECDRCWWKGFLAEGEEFCPECGEWVWPLTEDGVPEGCLAVLEGVEGEWRSVGVGKGAWEAQRAS